LRQPVAEAPPEPTASPRAAVTRLVARRPAVALQQPAEREPPAIRGTSPERLARALGTEVQIDDAGNPTVEMPDTAFSTAPRTVTRAAADATAPPQAAYEPAAVVSHTPEAGPPPPPKVDIDHITETVIDNIRRELLIEREQAGGPMDLL
jgi:hypothetical protein